jgi:hypothetical protein
MTQEIWTAVDRYITDLFVPPDAALTAALQASQSADLPSINVSPPHGKFLLPISLPKARREARASTPGASRHRLR